METIAALKTIVPRLREAYEALYTLTRPGPFVVGSLLALAGWALEGLATYQIVQGFADTQTTLSGATFSYATGTLAGALAMLPGGLGVAEVGMTGLLRVVSEQITPATAAAATILVRLATLWFGVAVGGVALLERPTSLLPTAEPPRESAASVAAQWMGFASGRGRCQRGSGE